MSQIDYAKNLCQLRSRNHTIWNACCYLLQVTKMVDGTELHTGHLRMWQKMLSLIFLGLCLASGLAGAWILVLTRIEMRGSD